MTHYERHFATGSSPCELWNWVGICILFGSVATFQVKCKYIQKVQRKYKIEHKFILKENYVQFYIFK